MANILVQNPLLIDTDLASYQAVQTLVAGSYHLGLKIRRIALVANAATVAGTVTITDPISTNNIEVPTLIAAAQAAGTLIYEKDFQSPVSWQDFKVTGVTATKTTLFVWFGY